MQAVILSAGKGTRLYPLTKDIPKVMVEILGKPLLEYHIFLLKKYRINNIFINLFTMPEKIIDYFSNGEKFGVRIEYSREDTVTSFCGPMLLGSAGALHNFKEKLKNDFFVLYGDVFMKVNLARMLKFHQHKNSLFTLAIRSSSHPADSDLVVLDANNRITDWLTVPHKKKNGYSNAGLYIINAEVLNFLPANVPLDFAHHFIPQLFTKIPLYGYLTSELMMDIGTPERYNKVTTLLKSNYE